MKLKLTKREKWNKKFVTLKEGARERGKRSYTEKTEIEKNLMTSLNKSANLKCVASVMKIIYNLSLIFIYNNVLCIYF